MVYKKEHTCAVVTRFITSIHVDNDKIDRWARRKLFTTGGLKLLLGNFVPRTNITPGQKFP